MRKSARSAYLLRSAFILWFFVFAFVPALALAGVGFSVATDDFQVSFGHDLNPYGGWVTAPTFGLVWRPSHVGDDWRPYSDGHWIYTSFGPVWESSEPWADDTYHYGNWVFDQGYGWVWVPGSQWNSCQVVWSTAPGYVGWMPAPPPGFDYERVYGSGYGNIAPNLWIFVDSQHFTAPNYHGFVVPRQRVVTILADRSALQIRHEPLRREEVEHFVGKPVQVRTYQPRKVEMAPAHQKENKQGNLETTRESNKSNIKVEQKEVQEPKKTQDQQPQVQQPKKDQNQQQSKDKKAKEKDKSKKHEDQPPPQPPPSR